MPETVWKVLNSDFIQKSWELFFERKKNREIASNNMSKLQILKDTATSGPGQTGSGSKSATSATSLLSSASASPRTKRKYKETLNFVSFHSKVNMRRKWRSKKSAFYKFVDLESDFDSSELNAYTVRGEIFSFLFFIVYYHRLLCHQEQKESTKKHWILSVFTAKLICGESGDRKKVLFTNSLTWKVILTARSWMHIR